MTSIAHPSSLLELLRHRHLLTSLTARDIRVRYRQSFLGLSWAVLLPLAMVFVFTFVFAGVIHTPSADVDMPYTLYAFAGLAAWTLFSSGLSGCVNSLVSNRNLVTKVYFPREVFPLSCIGSALIDFTVSLLVLVLMMIWYRVSGRWHGQFELSILFLPCVLLIQLVLMAGLGLILAMANLFYRDVRQIFGVALQLLMFVSAVVIPAPSGDSWFARLMFLNPVVPLMEAYRDCLLRGQWPNMGSLAMSAGLSVLILVVGWKLFHRAAHRFAEYI